jgi:hypothetical protein
VDAAAGPSLTPLDVTASMGFRAQSLRYSGREFYHYHRPPTGLYFELLRALRRDEAGVPLQEAWWRHPGEPDEKGYVDLHLRSLPTFLRYRRERAEFYADPRVAKAGFSRREDDRLLLRLKRSGLGPSVDLYLWDQQVRIPAIERYSFGGFHGGIAYHAPELGLQATLPILGGRLYVEPRHTGFNSGIASLPDSATTWLSTEFVRPVGERFDLGAGFDHVTTNLDGFRTATWNQYRFRGQARPFAKLFLDAFFEAESASLPSVTTTYARRRSTAGVDAGFYPVRHTAFRAGFFHQELRRTDSTTGEEQHPAWNGGWASARVSNPGLWTLSARIQDRALSRAPNATIPRLGLNDTLYYTHDLSVDGRADAFLGNRLDLYALYNWRRRTNGERDTRLTATTGIVGASAQVTPKLTLSAEFAQQVWSGDPTPFLIGGAPPPGVLPPELFFSDGRTLSAGASYQLDDRSSLELWYNRFTATGGQSARDRLATLQYRRRVSRDFYFGIGYQYEKFTDRTEGRRFRAFPLLIELGLNRRFR